MLNNFNRHDENRILGKRNHTFKDRHFWRSTIAEGVSKQNSHPFKVKQSRPGVIVISNCNYLLLNTIFKVIKCNCNHVFFFKYM